MNRWRQLAPAAGAALIGLALLLGAHLKGHLVEPVFLRYLTVWVPLVLLIEQLRRRAALPGAPVRAWPPLALLAALALFLVSSVTDHPWFFFARWLPRNGFGWHLLESDLGRFVLLTALLTPFLLAPPRRAAWLAAGLMLAAQAAAALRLWAATGGGALYIDDHPSFLFRLWELSRTGLQLINYSPYWNGGVVQSHFTQSGTAAIGLLAWPVWRFLPIDQAYTPVLIAVFIGLVPLAAAGSLRLMGANGTAAGCAGLLALGVSQTWFLWLLRYGTIGACLASACILPLAAALFRLLWLRRREWWTGLALVVSAGLLMMWPPALLMGAALLLAFLAAARRWSRRALGVLLGCTLLVLALQARRLAVLLLEMGWIGGGPLTAAPPGRRGLPSGALRGGFDLLRDYLRIGQPLILFFGIGGVWAAGRRTVRRWFGPLILGLLLLTGWGWIALPDQQVYRLAIPLFFAAIPPAALALADLLRTPGVHLALPRAAVLSLLALGAWNTAGLYGNEGRARFKALPPEIREMAALLKAEGGEGRVLFAGSACHGYGEGHVAFLPYLAGREMMACDYYHFSPAAVEYEYPPRPWRQTPEAAARFLELYNVTTVTTCRESYRALLDARPDLFRPLRTFGDGTIAFYAVRRAPSWFHANSGTVTATFNRIRVTLDQPDEPAVIAYNWHPALRATPPAELFPWEGGPGVTLIGIRPNGVRVLEIRYRNWL